MFRSAKAALTYARSVLAPFSLDAAQFTTRAAGGQARDSRQNAS